LQKVTLGKCTKEKNLEKGGARGRGASESKRNYTLSDGYRVRTRRQMRNKNWWREGRKSIRGPVSGRGFCNP